MLRSAVLIRRAVMMPRTYELSFLVAFNGPFVPPIKDARNEQPNDRQWQSEHDKRHSGADKHCEHKYPPPSFFTHQADRISHANFALVHICSFQPPTLSRRTRYNNNLGSG
jgi:hypothetical protein